MIVTIDIPFDFFQIVYLKHEASQLPRMIVGVKYCADGGILLELISGTLASWHYISEVSETRDQAILLQND